MKHLLENWDAFEQELGGKRIILGLDYDGTLTPIAPMPDDALLSQENRVVLQAFAQHPGCTLAIVSGRALKDVREKVGIENITYVGNHGLEASGHGVEFESVIPPQEREIMDILKKELAQNLSSIAGVWIEDKGLTLSVHYRLVKETDEPLVIRTFDKTCETFLAQNKIKVVGGKKVLEIRPPVEWDKGKVLLWLLAREHLAYVDERILPVFVGDDLTDEDVFQAIKGKGVGIIVGEGRESTAEYYMNTTIEVTLFLKRLLAYLTTQATTGR